MKCIILDNKSIVRTTNEKAEEMVRKGAAKFISRNKWKESDRKILK